MPPAPASCGRFYTRRCFLHERCVCVELLGVSDPPEACKVSFHARLNMSSLRCPICMVDDLDGDTAVRLTAVRSTTIPPLSAPPLTAQTRPPMRR